MRQLKTFLDILSRFAGTKTARNLVLGIFIAQALLLSFVTHIGVPPDENNHLGFIRYYADHSLSPVFDNQTPTWSLGDKTREVDYLYHYGASFVARVLPGETMEVYVIRIISALAALLTMIVLARLLRRLGVSTAAITVALAILTNLPMVLMVSAAVNNDVFVWLGYIVSLLLVLRLWKQPSLLDTVLLLNVIVAGGLIKRTLLPLGFIMVLTAGVLVYRKWRIFVKSIKKSDWRVVLGVVFLVIISGLFVERVGGNLYRYGEIAPTCEQVQGDEACEVFWANSRAKWLDAGSPPESNTWLAKGTARDDSPIAVPVFTVRWLFDSIANVVDIQTQGWRHRVTPPVWLAPTVLLLLLVTIGYGVVSDIRAGQKGAQAAFVRLFVIGTAAFIMAVHLYVNYSTYLSHQVYGLALNGRYILPSLLVLIGLGCYYGSLFMSRRTRQLVAVATILCVVLFSGIIMMLRNSQLITG